MTLNLARLTLARTRLMGMFAGASLAGWGLWLAMPFSLFARFGGIYALMERYAPETVWGLAFALAGTVLVMGELRGWRWAVGIGSIGVIIARLFVAILTGIYTQWESLGWIDHTLWALMALVCAMGAFRREP
jgi:hypothetical protein